MKTMRYKIHLSISKLHPFLTVLSNERLLYWLLFNESYFCFSEKLDIEKNSVGPGGIPADAIYTTTPRTGVRGLHSPDAMKVRLAAMVLQPPTRV